MHNEIEAPQNTRTSFHLPTDQLTGYPKKEFAVVARDGSEVGMLRLELGEDVHASVPQVTISLPPGTWVISEAMLLRAGEIMRAARFWQAGREA